MSQQETAFKSALENTIATAALQRGSITNWLDCLHGKVTAEELYWMRFPQRLHEAAIHSADGMLERQSVLDIVKDHAIRIKTLVADKMPSWKIGTVNDGFAHYATHAEATQALQDAWMRVRNELVDVRETETPGTFGVYSYEDCEPGASIESGVEGYLLREFPAGDYWYLDDKFYNREELEKNLPRIVTRMDWEQPESYPHTFEFLDGGRMLVFRDGTGAVAKDPDPLLEDAIHPATGAEGAAKIFAETVRQHLFARLHKPVMDMQERSFMAGETLFNRESYNPEGTFPYREILLVLEQPEALYDNKRWQHMKNVLASIRLTGLPDGTLFVEEVASDWAQDIASNRTRREDVPFVASGRVDDWLPLALQQVLHEAVAGGYAHVAFINGTQAMERYEVSDTFNFVMLTYDCATEQYTFHAHDRSGHSIIMPGAETYSLPLEKGREKRTLETLLGREQARKLWDAEPWLTDDGKTEVQKLWHDSWPVGDGGVKVLYDEILPLTLHDLLQTFDPAIVLEYVQPAETGDRQLRFRVTDVLREKVRDGLPLFRLLAHGRERTAAVAMTVADNSKTASLFDVSDCASPREVGLRAWKAIGGDLGNLDAIAKILDAQGYRLDTRCLQNLPDHPLSQREAFIKAVRQTTPTVQQKPDKAVER